MKTIIKFLPAVAVAAMPFGLLAGTVSASVVTVLNPIFQYSTPQLPFTNSNNQQQYYTAGAGSNVATDWTISFYGGVGDIGSRTGVTGTNVGFADLPSTAGTGIQADLYQDVGALQANTTYTMTVESGFNSGSATTGMNGVRELINGTTDAGSVLSSFTYNSTTTATSTTNPISANGDFNIESLSYTTGNTVSGDLTLVLGAYNTTTSAGQLGFNNVQVTATPVPEPATLGLVAIGGMSLLLLKRRKAV